MIDRLAALRFQLGERLADRFEPREHVLARQRVAAWALRPTSSSRAISDPSQATTGRSSVGSATIAASRSKG